MNRSRCVGLFLLFLSAATAVGVPTTAPTTRRMPATVGATKPVTLLPDPAKAPPAPFQISESSTKAEEASLRLRGMESELNADHVTPNIKDGLKTLTAEIAARVDETDRLLQTAPSLQLLENQEQDWTAIDQELARWADELKRWRELLQGEMKATDDHGKLASDWQQEKALATFYLPNPRAAEVMNSALAIIDPMIDRISHTHDLLFDRFIEVNKLQQAVDAQRAQSQDQLESVRESRAGAFNRLFVRNEPPVWSIFHSVPGNQSIAQQGADSFDRQLSAVWAYLQRRSENAGGQLLLLIGLIFAIYFVRGKVVHLADKDPGFDRAKLLFASPIATAVVLSILFSGWIYPQAPRLFWAILGAAALIPTVIILRHLIDRRLFTILNALVIFYFMDQIRAIAAAVPLISRPVFLAEMLGATLLLHSFIGDIRDQPVEDRFWQFVRFVSWMGFATFLFSFLANATGFVSLSNLLGDASLRGAYFAVILYAFASIIVGLLVITLRIRPLNLLRMVREHQPLVARRLTLAVQWIAAGIWLYQLMVSLSVSAAVYSFAWRVVHYPIDIIGFTFELSSVLKFALIIWLSFLVSRFLRFLLEQDVYTHFTLPEGSAYAISKMLNYVVLLLGFFAALHALHYSLDQFAILAGAFTVGIGFGMQNIVNNFVSGLILLFERPVKVNDVIQMGDVSGVVSYIGIRASVLKTSESSEIIIPNGNLISNQVTNWTHTNKLRGVSIPVSVVASADPKLVIDLLTRTAAAHKRVVKIPPPQAYLTKFSADQFSYELHVWTNEAVEWIQIRSDLAVALNAALAKENIPIK